jgi:hypothetical protein
MVGHDDSGYLIATVYTKLAQRHTPLSNPKLRRAPNTNAKGKGKGKKLPTLPSTSNLYPIGGLVTSPGRTA